MWVKVAVHCVSGKVSTDIDNSIFVGSVRCVLVTDPGPEGIYAECIVGSVRCI